MSKYCYSKDIFLTREKLMKEMDLALFFDPNISNKNSNALQKLLETLGIYSENLDYMNSQVTIRMIDPQKDLITSNISNAHYDQNNKLTSQFTIFPGNGTLLSLEGEIYEQLQLDLEGVSQFRKEHQYEQHIYPETRSCIHFKGIEYIRSERLLYEHMLKNMGDRILTVKEQQIVSDMHEKTKETKEIYITKDSQKFQFYYNGPHIFNNLCPDSSLSIEEIGYIQNRIQHLLLLNGNQNMKIDLNCPQEGINDNEQFLEYVYTYLGQYRKLLETRKMNLVNGNVIDKDSVKKLTDCIQGDYSNGLYCEINIISNTPIPTTEEKNRQFLKMMQ